MVNMPSFLPSRKSGISNNLSSGIHSSSFAPHERTRLGINSQISCLAYEPVQSLLAIGTNETKYGPGKISIYGIGRVQKHFVPPRPSSIRQLSFVANRLISLDSKGELGVWDLKVGSLLARHTFPGASCVVTDPMLDWAFVGCANGDIHTYDLDRQCPGPLNLPNFWKQKKTDAVVVLLVGMSLHPRDIGKLLIAYNHGAVVYSFKQNAPTRFFEYILQPGAPGGHGETLRTVRRPRLTHALWHPTGTFILTAHDDGSLVFWDTISPDAKLVTARTLYSTNIHKPGYTQEKPCQKVSFAKIAWCCKQDPDDTALLMAGGKAVDDPQQGLTFMELGRMPLYQTSSWDVLANHLEGKRNLTINTPPGAQLVDFCLLPRTSPHFSGAQDPIAILTMLSSGEIITLSFPSGHPISPTNMLHPSMSLVHPFVQKAAVTSMDQASWLRMTETRDRGDLLVQGGAETVKRKKKHQKRNIIQLAHADGIVRLFDLGRGDEIENPSQVQLDLGRALGRYENIDISMMHLSEVVGEFAVGTKAGEVVVYRWGLNQHYGKEEPKPVDTKPGDLTDISSRTEPDLKEGLQPFVLYEMMKGPISVIKVSDGGFVGVGSEAGFFSLIDLRGPSVILQTPMVDVVVSKKEKRLSFLSRHSHTPSQEEWPVIVEFGVMKLDDDKYSSMACFVGTNLGHVVTFKILPVGQGYSTKLAGSTKMDSRIVSISPILADTGKPAALTGQTMTGLGEGRQVHGILVVTTQTDIRILNPTNSQGAAKVFQDLLCDASCVAEFEDKGVCLIGVFGHTCRAFSLPGLKEMGRSYSPILDLARTPSTMTTKTGEIIGWTGPSELVIIDAWESDQPPESNQDTLINPDLVIAARPTISNLQWLGGTQYVSPTDLDILIGGPDRPASKRMMDATAEERRMGGKDAATASVAAPSAGTGEEGWGDYLTRQLNERTEKLNRMSESMDKLQDASAGWADDVRKFVGKQKRGILLAGITKGRF